MHLETIVQKKLFSTTINGINFGKGEASGGHMQIQGYQRQTGTGGDPVITDMDWVTGSTYLGDPGVDRHHLIIPEARSIFRSFGPQALLQTIYRSTQFVWFLMHSCLAFIDAHSLGGSSKLCRHSYPVTHFICSSSQNYIFSRIPFQCLERCGGVFLAEFSWRTLCLPATLFHRSMIVST